MSSTFSTGQSERRGSGSSSSHTMPNMSPGSARVVPGTKTSGQKGKETIPSTTTTFPPANSSPNASYKSPNSPPPSQRSGDSPSVSQRGSVVNLKLEDVDNWSLAVQGANVPEEVKAIVRTGTHTWSRGISQKANTTVASTATPAGRD